MTVLLPILYRIQNFLFYETLCESKVLDFSTFSAFKFCIDKQYFWSPLPEVNTGPCSTSYSLYFFADKVLCVCLLLFYRDITDWWSMCYWENFYYWTLQCKSIDLGADKRQLGFRKKDQSSYSLHSLSIEARCWRHFSAY